MLDFYSTDAQIADAELDERIEMCRYFMEIASGPDEARQWWVHMAFWIRKRRVHRAALADIAAGLRE